DWRWIGETEGQVHLVTYAGHRREGLPDFNSLSELLLQKSDWRLLSGLEAGRPGRGRTICACLEVQESDIVDAIRSGTSSIAALGERLGCGTNCGSCVPELRGLLATNARGGSI
ncbi:MAG: (2Fe-2S)-binding protein, partial [Pseudomonadales bacterium]|nr:(2Fe-2S)-binding protein [Pseudomonadales bacterium]